MRILQLTTHFSPNVGGVETHLSDLIRSLINKNYKVFVLTYRPLVTKAPWKIYEKKKNLEIFRIPWMRGFFYTFVSHPILEFLYLIPGIFLITPFIIFVKKPQIIHAHGLIAGFVGVFWGKLLRKKIIISLHNIYHFPKSGLYKQFAMWIFSNAQSILCLSSQSVEEIGDLDIQKNKIHQFTYWVDLKKFQTVPNAKKQLKWDKKFTILFVGRLVAEKGIKELLESVTIWNKNIQLVIIGVGPLEAEIKIQNEKIKNMQFLGKVNNELLPLYYSGTDLLIVPSMHEEGFGRVILESLGCGTPVIGAKRGAIPDAMDETVGTLIKVTPNNIKNTVEYYSTHPKILAQLKKNCILFAQKRYSEKNIEEIIKWYT